MKTKMIIAIAALMVFGLSMVAFAYTTTAGATVASASCCKGDSCPMKSKNASTGEKASCCDDCDCCSGDSCPMKSKSEAHASAMKTADSDSCPMKMKAENAKTVKVEHANVVTVKGDENCCSCCGNEAKTKMTAGL